MKKNLLFTVSGLMTLLLTLHFSSLKAQEAVKPRPSPTAIVTLKYENTYIKVTYCQPHKRGREIFGGLVPYGEVWRTGANEATEITVTETILIGGEKLPEGTYSIYTIPEKDHWTVIFNKELGQWGSYNYHEKNDLLRIKVPTSEIPQVTYEPFTINFQQKNNGADMIFLWDKTQVRIPLEFLD